MITVSKLNRVVMLYVDQSLNLYLNEFFRIQTIRIDSNFRKMMMKLYSITEN